jgi:hypothetical protein
MSRSQEFGDDANIPRVREILRCLSSDEEEVVEFLKKTRFEILAAYADPRTKFKRREAANEAFRILFGRNISRDDYQFPSNDSEADSKTDSEADSEADVHANVHGVATIVDDDATSVDADATIVQFGSFLVRVIDNSSNHEENSDCDFGTDTSSDSEVSDSEIDENLGL